LPQGAPLACVLQSAVGQQPWQDMVQKSKLCYPGAPLASVSGCTASPHAAPPAPQPRCCACCRCCGGHRTARCCRRPLHAGVVAGCFCSEDLGLRVLASLKYQVRFPAAFQHRLPVRSNSKPNPQMPAARPAHLPSLLLPLPLPQQQPHRAPSLAWLRPPPAPAAAAAAAAGLCARPLQAAARLSRYHPAADRT